MGEFKELRALLDTMSDRLKKSWGGSDAQWTDTVEELLYGYSREVARALLKFAPEGGKHFVLVWPGINLRLGLRHLNRYFLTPPLSLNGLPIKSGALIYCSSCANSAGLRCAEEEEHLRLTAPLYAFDHLLAGDRELKLRGSDSAGLPVLGTHAWLLSEPKFRSKDDDLWILRVTKDQPLREQDLFDASFHRHGVLSAHVGTDSHDFGMRLGAAIDSLFPTNKQWPYRPGQPPLENIHVHRCIYDLWLTSVFAPSDLYDQLTRVSNLFDVPTSLLLAALQLRDSVPYQEWISWRLAPTIPILDDKSSEDEELGPELGSLMVLTTFPIPLTEDRSTLWDQLRHYTEHAYLKLRTGDDAQIAERWATAIAIAPLAHELRKWSDSLQWLFGHSSPNPDWINLATQPWSSTGLHKELAALFADALFFSTAPVDSHLGLLTVSKEQQVAASINNSLVAACALFNLAIARAAGTQITERIAVAQVLSDLQIEERKINVRIIGPRQFVRWLDCGIETDDLAYLTHILVTHLLNFLKHGDWTSGVDLEINYSESTGALDIIGTNLVAKNDQWISMLGTESVTTDVKSLMVGARTERINKLASSMRTLRSLERQSRRRVRCIDTTGDQEGRWRWGVVIEPNANTNRPFPGTRGDISL